MIAKIMPPHLHPRSRTTSSLFGATVFFSFLVVGIPHIIPCPAPRVTYADGEIVEVNGKLRRRKRPQNTETKDGFVEFEGLKDGSVLSSHNTKRTCPVPKPGGVVGDMLGFKEVKSNEKTASRQRPSKEGE